LRDVFYPILEFEKKKQIFVKIEGGNADFFLKKKGMTRLAGMPTRGS